MKGFKETDIRPDKIMQEQVKHIETDRNFLLKYKSKFVEIPCPACNSDNNEFKFIKNDLNYVICKKCETVYINPRPTEKILEQMYSKSAVYEFWNKYVYPATEEARREFIFRPRVEKIIDFCKTHNFSNPFLMEVGAGFGTFCDEANKFAFFKRIIGVEPTSDGAESCRKKGIVVLEKPIEKIDDYNESIDIIVSFEVIEHIFSPNDFIKNCKKMLKPEGLIVITCPNFKGFDITVLGKESNSLDHEHINLFNLKSLSFLLETNGFEILNSITPGKLDAELVRKKILYENYDISNQPFLKQILIDEWETKGEVFQQFLSDNRLSSSMWIVAKKHI